MPNMILLPNGLDREHDAPRTESYLVTAPYELNSYDSVEWALKEYGDVAETIECMGRWNGQIPSMGYVFRITPRVSW